MAYIGFGIFQKMLDAMTGKETLKKETAKHSHSQEILFTVDDAPTKSGGHTYIAVMRCGGCPQVTFFPSANFKLTTEEYQKEMLEALVEKGYQPVNA